MARYTLVYGLRLVPEGSLEGVDEVRLKLKDGETAGLTLHTIDGTIPQLRRGADRRLDAVFDFLPGAAGGERQDFRGLVEGAVAPGRRICGVTQIRPQPKGGGQRFSAGGPTW